MTLKLTFFSRTPAVLLTELQGWYNAVRRTLQDTPNPESDFDLAGAGEEDAGRYYRGHREIQ
jgi:hypothetical protein